MRRVLFVHPSFQPPGGGNGVAAWMLQALRGRYEVGVLTLHELDLPAINRFFGTSLQPADFTMEPLPLWMRMAATLKRAELLKHGLLARAARSVSASYDVAVSPNNEADLGRPGIQYIHFPVYQRPRPAHDLRSFHRIPGLLPSYYWLADRLAGYSAERMKRNLTVTNSDWTARLVHGLHGIRSRTLYPPVPAGFVQVPWDARMEAFICVGRISPEKRLERVIDIVKRVRQRFPNVTLCLLGTPGPDPYYRHIKDLVRDAGGWIVLREDLSRDELVALVPTYRYGIHGMSDEHFGMGPAELAAAGCIVFVPNSGGQVEIVDGDPRLVYDAVDQAATAITRVMEDPSSQREIVRKLHARAQMFTVDRFVAGFREIIDQAMTTA